jgi:hypothetical protein
MPINLHYFIDFERFFCVHDAFSPKAADSPTAFSIAYGFKDNPPVLNEAS